MSVNNIITSITNDLILSNSHWLRVTNLSSFPKHIKYKLGKLPIITNCELNKSNRNNNNKMKILMKNIKTNQFCLYKLILKRNDDENINADKIINNLKSILSLYNALNKENEDNKKKVLDLEAAFQPEDEVLI